MPRKPKWWHMVQAAKGEALLAVDLYNQPIERRTFEGFVVHMHIAWLYLLHAEVERDGTDYRYWEENRRRLVKIDGEPKTWELQECVKQRWSDNDPVRSNIALFIGLRNKIEHRFDRSIVTLTTGHAQAHIVNFERELVGQFGDAESMGDELRFPIFLHTITDQATVALQATYDDLPPKTRDYLTAFESDLDPEIRDDLRFEFRVFLVPQTGSKTAADMAVSFVREDQLSDEVRAKLAELGRTGRVIVRERQRPVIHLDGLRAREVVDAVECQLPFRFTMWNFIQAWKHFNIRPSPGGRYPERTDEKYCFYDKPHNDYVYTNAWVRKLVRECKEESGYRAIFNKAPELKERTAQ